MDGEARGRRCAEAGRDGPYGSIASNWNSHSWPNIYVLDRNGTIRHRGLRFKDLDDAVDKLMQE